MTINLLKSESVNTERKVTLKHEETLKRKLFVPEDFDKVFRHE